MVLRAEAVEMAQAGDKCDFTGTLIVVPDVANLSTPGIYYENLPIQYTEIFFSCEKLKFHWKK